MSVTGKIVGGLCICMTGLAAVNVVKALSDSPAFVEAARVDGVLGEWRLNTGTALYDRSEYLFQLGYGYINADGVFSTAGEDIGQVAGASLGIERGERAVNLISESLRLSPGNAHAWATLAEANMITNDFEAAFAALRQSWELAPYNASLSVRRLTIAETALELREEAVIFGVEDLAPPELTEADLLALAGDFEVAEKFNKRLFDDFMTRAILVPALFDQTG